MSSSSSLKEKSLPFVVLFVLIINSEAILPPHSVCQKINKVVVHYRDYYHDYLGRDASSGNLNTRALHYVYINSSVTFCCPNTILEFVYENTTEDDVETIAVTNTHRMKSGTPRNFSFYYPEFVEDKQKTVYDFQLKFTRLARSPGQALVMLTPPPTPQVFLFDIFRDSLPILSLLLALSWAVGILGWMADHWKNPKEFPSPFILGIFDGFWWSVVTLTTVGYGDKCPRSIPARALAVIWVLFSAVLLSLFTANATAILSSRQQPVDYSKTIGKKIGVIQSKEFDDFQLNLGARIINYENFSSLTDALMKNEIERVIFPNYKDLLLFFSRDENRESANLYKIVRVFDSPFQIGMALAFDPHHITPDDEIFLECFQTVITLTEKKVKKLTSKSDGEIRGIETLEVITSTLHHGRINQFTCYVLIAIGVLLIFGLSWDLWKYTTRNKTRPEPVISTELELNNNELGESNGAVAPRRDDASWF